MKLFFKYPERKFHLRELERLTKLSLPGVKKITEKLEKESLVFSKKEKVVKNIYATRNEKFVHLKQVYNIYSIFSTNLLKIIAEKYQQPEAIILFGSYAKGEDITKSDIDIAVITSETIELNLDKFERELNRKIKIYEIKIKKAEKEFLNTLANGVVLYGFLNIIK